MNNCRFIDALFKVALPVVVLMLLGGCATTATDSVYRDPYENFNRSVADFNYKSDQLVLRPVAQAYARTVPDPIRRGVSNFFSNLFEPLTIVNDLLQGKFAMASRDASRFLINSTIGVLGIFDVASRIDLPRRREDFGQTLAVWGVPSGPYLVLPFLGPSNVRDAAGLVPRWVYYDPLLGLDSPADTIALGLRFTDARARLLGTDELLYVQPDQYLFLRETYRQSRVRAIHDGDPPVPKGHSADDLIDQLLDE